jgi:hypothetical protein
MKFGFLPNATEACLLFPIGEAWCILGKNSRFKDKMTR